MRRTSYPIWLSSCLMVLVLVGLVLPAAAQPATNSDAPKRGADSAKLAAEGALTALKAQNLEALKNLVTAEHLPAFDASNRALFACVRVQDYTLQALTESGAAAVATYVWKANVDVERLVNVALEHYRKTALAEGQSQDDVAQMLATLRQVFQLRAETFKLAVERADHRMTLVQEQGRWFVLELIDLAEGDKQGNPSADADESTAGGSTPKELAERVLNNWSKAKLVDEAEQKLAAAEAKKNQKDIDAAKKALEAASKVWDDMALCMPPGQNRDLFRNNPDRTLPKCLRIKKFELREVKLNEGGDTAKVNFRWDMTFDDRRYVEIYMAQNEASAKKYMDEQRAKGLSADELKRHEAISKQALDQARKQILQQAAMWKRHLEKKDHVMTVRKEGEHERWYVMQPIEMPDPAGDGNKQGTPDPQEQMQRPTQQNAQNPSAKTEGVVFPAQVCKAYLEAWQKGQLDVMRDHVMLAAQGPHFDANAELLKHVNVKSFEIGSTTVTGDTAVVTFTWSATLNEAGFAAAAKTHMLMLAQQAGRPVNLQPQDEIVAVIREYVDRVKETVAQPKLELTLAKVDGVWRVAQPVPFSVGPAPTGITGGADTPHAAAEGYLKAWKARNAESLLKLTTPESRESFRAYHAGFLTHIHIAEATVGTISMRDTIGQATFTWRATFDRAGYVKTSVEQALEASGADGSEREAMRRELTQSYTVAASEWATHIEQTTHTMTLERVANRWFVVLPLDAPMPEITGGADSPEAVLNAFETALRNHDAAKIEDLLVPALRDSARWAAHLTLTQWRVVTQDADNANSDVVFGLTVKATLTLDTEGFMAAEIAHWAKLNQVAPDRLATVAAQMKQRLMPLVAALKKIVAQDDHRIVIQKLGSKWFIAEALVWTPDGLNR